MMKELVLKSRSIRRFHQGRAIDEDTLRELVDLARLGPSGANRQPLKYAISRTPEINAKIFPNLAWAGYLAEWRAPEEGERPSAYIIILGDKEVAGSFGVDHGIAAQNICLGAAEKGLGACIVGSIKIDKLRTALNLPQKYDIMLAIALGYPREKVVIEEVLEGGDVKYWRDAEGVHHVPKRALDDVIVQI